MLWPQLSSAECRGLAVIRRMQWPSCHPIIRLASNRVVVPNCHLSLRCGSRGGSAGSSCAEAKEPHPTHSLCAEVGRARAVLHGNKTEQKKTLLHVLQL